MVQLPLLQPIVSLASSLLVGLPLPFWRSPLRADEQSVPTATACQRSTQGTQFLVMAGGGAPTYNEIALEKNVLYFQRTLQAMGYTPASASVFFANGNDGQATIRYLDEQRQEQFKVPEIPDLQGAATFRNLQNWIRQTARDGSDRPIFFYFTGHGARNGRDINNNALILWDEEFVSVRQLTALLDELPSDKPIVTMMAQCYAGSFANLIYEDGNPQRPVALQTRCGFFATIKTRPSVGCTAEVNEADYEDYSSSFFAGLSGQSRTGETVASADYNGDGTVAYAEAHAFTKVDSHTPDYPVSTVEVWLQERASQADKDRILQQPIAYWSAIARPEQQFVINTLVREFRLNVNRSFVTSLNTLKLSQTESEVQDALLTRLGMELVNVGMEQTIRQSGDAEAIATLDRLIDCESGSWESP